MVVIGKLALQNLWLGKWLRVDDVRSELGDDYNLVSSFMYQPEISDCQYLVFECHTVQQFFAAFYFVYDMKMYMSQSERACFVCGQLWLFCKMLLVKTINYIELLWICAKHLLNFKNKKESETRTFSCKDYFELMFTENPYFCEFCNWASQDESFEDWKKLVSKSVYIR